MSESAIVERFNDFLVWERGTRDTIDLKKIYIDMAGDLKAGVMLSQIIYWYLPSKGRAEGKLTIYRSNNWWIVKKRHEWWEETRLTPREVDRAIEVLVAKNLVVTERHQFGKTLSTYIRINKEVFLPYLNHILHNPLTNPYSESNSPKSELVDDTNSPAGELPPTTNSRMGEFYNTETTLSKTTSTPAVAGSGKKPRKKKTTNVVEFPKERSKDLLFEGVLLYGFGIKYTPLMDVPERTAGHVRGIVKELKTGNVDPHKFVTFCESYKTWSGGLSFPRAGYKVLASFNDWNSQQSSDPSTDARWTATHAAWVHALEIPKGDWSQYLTRSEERIRTDLSYYASTNPDVAARLAEHGYRLELEVEHDPSA
jgi:hypothetical protein